MSRLYSMEMIVSKNDGEKLSVKDQSEIQEVFKEQWNDDPTEWTDNCHFQREAVQIFFSAESSLCGGESEEEAHDRIVRAVKAVVPTCSVTTRWTYLEDLPYEEYTD